MIQIYKDNSNIPEEYLNYLKSKQFRKIDLLSGRNKSLTGREIFTSIKKKKEIFAQFKKKLLLDQGYICCYCNCRIELKNSSVEHLVTIESNKSLVAEYENLLIACNGGRDERYAHGDSYPLYCDASRSKQDLDFTPLDIDCWSSFQYSITNGKITGENQNGINLIRTLNLDCTILRNNRLNAFELLFDDDHQLLELDDLEKIWDSCWKKDSNGKYEPYFYPILICIYNLI